MLTLLPALLTIFGRRAFWPFVPHTPRPPPATTRFPRRRGAAIVEGSGRVRPGQGRARRPASSWSSRRWSFLNWFSCAPQLFGQIPSLIVGPLDRAFFTPYEMRRHEREHAADATHGFWARLGNRIAVSPRRIALGSIAVLLVLCAGLATFSTDLTSEDSYRTEVESVEGQHLLDKSFPSGATALTDIVVPNSADVPAVREAVSKVDGVDAVSRPVAAGPPGALVQATLEPNPYSTEAFDLIEPIRDAAHSAAPGTLVGGPTAVEFDVRDAAGWDSMVIPPIILLVVFLILIGLLRAVVAPLILIGTVILSYLAALGVGYFFIDFVFDFPGSDPSLPLFAFVFLVALGVDYNIFLIARAREETIRHGSEQGILRALAVTGAVITSAGIVLAGTFSVLAVLPLTFLTELGFVVAFGVLLDTFLVRSVLVPALALMAGDNVLRPGAGADPAAGDSSPGASADKSRTVGPSQLSRAGGAAEGGRERTQFGPPAGPRASGPAADCQRTGRKFSISYGVTWTR